MSYPAVDRLKSWFNVIKRKEYFLKVIAWLGWSITLYIAVGDILAMAGKEYTFPLVTFLLIMPLITVVIGLILWPRKIEGTFARNSTLRVLAGDLLDHQILESKLVVVGTSCGFDTDVDTVSSSSVQAQVTRRFFSPFKTDGSDQSENPDSPITPEQNLSHMLHRSLESSQTTRELVLGEPIRPGGPAQYPPGTNVTVSSRGGFEFLFLAYTKNDGQYITCQPDIVWKALWQLWKDRSTLPAGTRELAMPAIGTLNAGMSDRLGIEGSIKLIILSYAFAAETYPNGLPDVSIVLRPKDFHQINRSDLRNFINTLTKKY